MAAAYNATCPASWAKVGAGEGYVHALAAATTAPDTTSKYEAEPFHSQKLEPEAGRKLPGVKSAMGRYQVGG